MAPSVLEPQGELHSLTATRFVSYVCRMAAVLPLLLYAPMGEPISTLYLIYLEENIRSL